MDFCQVIFGIYDNPTGEIVYENKLFDPVPCEQETQLTQMSIFNQYHQIAGLPPSQQYLLVFEVQYFMKEEEPKAEKLLQNYGWSYISLFDAQNKLMTGKWKIPVYQGKTTPNINLESG